MHCSALLSPLVAGMERRQLCWQGVLLAGEDSQGDEAPAGGEDQRCTGRNSLRSAGGYHARRLPHFILPFRRSLLPDESFGLAVGPCGVVTRLIHLQSHDLSGCSPTLGLVGRAAVASTRRQSIPWPLSQATARLRKHTVDCPFSSPRTSSYNSRGLRPRPHGSSRSQPRVRSPCVDRR